MTMQLVLRDAVSGDEPSIRRVVHTVLRDYGFEPDPSGFDADIEDVVANYHDRGGLFRVLVDDAGEIVGCGGIYPLDAEAAQIRKMYTLAHARGLGLGRQLLDELIAHARAKGFSRVVLQTSSRLPGAGAHIYRKAGFVDVVPSHVSARADMAMSMTLR
jgi:putative acetyltransferase